MKVNRRKMLSLLGVSPAILAGAPALAKPSKSPAVAKIDPGKITALNPRGLPPAIQLIPMAPRLAHWTARPSISSPMDSRAPIISDRSGTGSRRICPALPPSTV